MPGIMSAFCLQPRPPYMSCRPQRRRTYCRALFDSSTQDSSTGNHDSNGASSSGGQQQHSSLQHPALLFPEPQPPATGPLLVQTQRGTPSFLPAIADLPCPHCGGLGKTTCGDCRGKGRLNYREAAMLPEGVWPQWCPTCRATGRWYCPRCMGIGVRRQPIGFRPLPQDDVDEEP